MNIYIGEVCNKNKYTITGEHSYTDTLKNIVSELMEQNLIAYEDYCAEMVDNGEPYMEDFEFKSMLLDRCISEEAVEELIREFGNCNYNNTWSWTIDEYTKVK